MSLHKQQNWTGTQTDLDAFPFLPFRDPKARARDLEFQWSRKHRMEETLLRSALDVHWLPCSFFPSVSVASHDSDVVSYSTASRSGLSSDPSNCPRDTTDTFTLTRTGSTVLIPSLLRPPWSFSSQVSRVSLVSFLRRPQHLSFASVRTSSD